LRRTACGELQIDPLAPRERRCYKASICATRQYGWGNLLNITATKCQVNQTNLSLNSSNPSSNQISGWSYDAAGNTLNTGAGTESYTWNAEERMATVASSLYGDDTYVYDGDGERVKKASGKVYWHGAGGEVLAESDLGGNITAEYVFFDGERLARIDASGSVDYYLSDKLGSSAVVTDSGGNVLDDSDFLPFGDELDFASSSGNAYKYTGLERDADQLDHTLNRQYSSNFGRWMTPDPGGRKVVKLDDPQTWNMYAYVGNNPTSLNDPSGLYACNGNNQQCQTFKKALNAVRKADAALKEGTFERKRLDAVLKFYGTDNGKGPAIAFANLKGAIGVTHTEHGKTTITLDPKQLGRYGEPGRGETVAHEGTHGMDANRTEGGAGPFWTVYDKEYRAYQSESYVDMGLGRASESDQYPGWAPGMPYSKHVLDITRDAYQNALYDCRAWGCTP